MRALSYSLSFPLGKFSEPHCSGTVGGTSGSLLWLTSLLYEPGAGWGAVVSGFIVLPLRHGTSVLPAGD